MSKSVNALVLTGFGLNCDNETAYTLNLAGAKAQCVHINALINGAIHLQDFQLLVFGGGFSWGDDHYGGVILAVCLNTNFSRQMLDFIAIGNLLLGICNGFQTLVNLGLLPGLDGDYQTRSVALTFNDCGNFRNDWVSLTVNPKSPCVFTTDIQHTEFPIRHGEGKLVADEPVIKRLVNNNQVVIRYARANGEPANGVFPFNPNGSLYDIAGLCDPTGRIFGLMPHPEAFNHFTNHPDWTRSKEKLKRQGRQINAGETLGVRLFKNGVDYILKGCKI